MHIKKLQTYIKRILQKLQSRNVKEHHQGVQNQSDSWKFKKTEETGSYMIY